MDAPSTFAPPAYRQRRPRSFIFPLLLVVVGVVLLLNNLGILSWSVWTALGQLWPAILILLGIDLLVGRRGTWLGASLAILAFVSVIGVAIWMTFTGFTPSASAVSTVPSNASIALAGATSGQVALQFGAGELNVGALPADSTDLAQVTASLPSNVHITQESKVQGDVIDATIGTSSGGSGWPFRGFDRGSIAKLDANLVTRVPLVLRAEMGAGQSNFDLTDLSVRQFTLNNGAGEASIHFPKSAGQTTADIHSGAGKVILYVPDGVGASIHGSNGLVNLHASDRFQRTDGGYQTSDVATAQNRVDVTLHVGVGDVDVR